MAAAKTKKKGPLSPLPLSRAVPLPSSSQKARRRRRRRPPRAGPAREKATSSRAMRRRGSGRGPQPRSKKKRRKKKKPLLRRGDTCRRRCGRRPLPPCSSPRRSGAGAGEKDRGAAAPGARPLRSACKTSRRTRRPWGLRGTIGRSRGSVFFIIILKEKKKRIGKKRTSFRFRVSAKMKKKERGLFSVALSLSPKCCWALSRHFISDEKFKHIVNVPESKEKEHSRQDKRVDGGAEKNDIFLKKGCQESSSAFSSRLKKRQKETHISRDQVDRWLTLLYMF